MMLLALYTGQNTKKNHFNSVDIKLIENIGYGHIHCPICIKMIPPLLCNFVTTKHIIYSKNIT